MLNESEIIRFKNALAEELEDYKFEKKRIAAALEELPKGTIVEKTINGKVYNYLLFRENGKVKTKYIGKTVPNEIRQRYFNSMEVRSKNKQLIARITKRIECLKKCIKALYSLSATK